MSTAVHCVAVGQSTPRRYRPARTTVDAPGPAAAGSNGTCLPSALTPVHWWAVGQSSARMSVPMSTSGPAAGLAGSNVTTRRYASTATQRVVDGHETCRTSSPSPRSSVMGPDQVSGAAGAAAGARRIPRAVARISARRRAVVRVIGPSSYAANCDTTTQFWTFAIGAPGSPGHAGEAYDRGMKRSSELAVLSREHHVALELALRLQRATEADAALLRVAALGFWRDEGREHFRLEEELLLPAFAAHVGEQDEDIERVLAEHADIRRRIDELERQNAPEVAALTALGEVLRDHVRHEERTVFGRVEAALDDEQLAALGTALESAGGEHRPPRA